MADLFVSYWHVAVNVSSKIMLTHRMLMRFQEVTETNACLILRAAEVWALFTAVTNDLHRKDHHVIIIIIVNSWLDPMVQSTPQ